MQLSRIKLFHFLILYSYSQKMQRKVFLISFLILFSNSIFAQDWTKKMADPSINFYDVQTSFNTYWKKEERKEKFKSFFTFQKKTEQEENEGFTMYKRWENFVEPRVFPSGDRSLLGNRAKELEKLISDYSYRGKMMAAGNWQPLGAFVIPFGGGGAGRLNCVRFHPTNPNIIFVGAPAGGLWKTTDGGTSWSTTTDMLPTLGVSDIAIDFTDANIMYIGTGDMDASDTYGVGVLKSIDGGITWNITGLNFTIMQGRSVNRVMISPNNHNMIYAGTSVGLFRSLDAGVSWSRVLSVNGIKDIEFKPGDASVMYACSAVTFYRSINSGASFNSITAGLPFFTSVSRLAIAVTPADPNYIYLLYSDNVSNSFKAIYRSTDGGLTFTLQTDYPNLLGYDPDGLDSGGQGWYTLSIAASPVNAEQIVVGGVNVWESFDGGYTWFISSHWYGAGGLPYVHADIHDLIYRPGTADLFAACDGGIFKTIDDGATWNDLSSGLQIGQMYRLGCSATNPDFVTQGWQDNGTNSYNAGTWNYILGGDGMETFIDWSSAAYVYGEYQNGALQRSSNGGISFTDITSGITETGTWITPWVQDPISSTTIYAGFKNVWKSINRGNSWTKISSFNSSLTCLEVAKTNPLYIYASNGSQIYRTIDGGITWTTLIAPLAGTGTITHVAVSTTDPTKIWMTRSGYSADNKIYKSSDAGDNWINVSYGLPNIPANCVVNQTGTSDGIYVGTDIGVYYLDNTLSSFMPYSNGLPNVIIDELEIQYSSNKLRAASYGRGLWETTIYNSLSSNPFPNFVGDTLSGCPGFTVNFTDSTTNTPTAWLWSFPGGTPATSTLQNPTIVYNNPGTYNNVTLVVTNSAGTDSITKLSYITVSPLTPATITLNNNDSLCSGQSVGLFSTYGNTYLWHPTNQTSPIINVNTTGTYSVTVKDAFGCAVNSSPVDVYVFALPASPVITQSGDTLTSSYSNNNQWYFNGTALVGDTNQTFIMVVTGNYYVIYTVDSSGCTSQSNTIVGIQDENSTGVSFNLFPNPSNGITTLVLQTTSPNDAFVNITDVLGKKVYEKNYKNINRQIKSSIDLSEFGKGIYILTISNEKGTVSKKVIVY